MTPQQIREEAERRLAKHAITMAELLGGLECFDWGMYVECEEQFLAYPIRCTWQSFDVFRIYLTEGTSCEYLDIYLRNWDQPRWVMYHLDLLAGGTDVLVPEGSDAFEFAVEMMKAVGDFTH
jgi:hypothetical protein